jgi:hypothetical protein
MINSLLLSVSMLVSSNLVVGACVPSHGVERPHVSGPVVGWLADNRALEEELRLQTEALQQLNEHIERLKVRSHRTLRRRGELGATQTPKHPEEGSCSGSRVMRHFEPVWGWA